MYKIHCKCPKQEYQENCVEENLLDTTCQNVLSGYEGKCDECACGFDEQEQVFPSNTMFGYAYVPMQKLDKVFKPCVGLEMGTMFPELVNPYAPLQSIEESGYLRKKEMEGCNCGCC